jgi:hypothetical protein
VTDYPDIDPQDLWIDDRGAVDGGRPIMQAGT